MGINQRPVGR